MTEKMKKSHPPPIKFLCFFTFLLDSPTDFFEKSVPPTQFLGLSLPSDMGRRNYGDSRAMDISLCYCLLHIQIPSSGKG